MTERTLEDLLREGKVEAALILDPAWGPLADREVELIRKAWQLGLETGKRLSAKESS